MSIPLRERRRNEACASTWTLPTLKGLNPKRFYMQNLTLDTSGKVRLGRSWYTIAIY